MDKNILYSINQKYEKLPKAERRLAEYVREHASQIVSMNVTVLAEAAAVSPATIVRFCHSLELKGFTDLKLSLSAVYPLITEESYSEIIANEPIEQIQKKLKQNILDGLDVTNKELAPSALLKAVKCLKKADNVYTTGIGASYLVAQDIEQKLNRVGKGTLATQDHHFLTTAMVTQQQQSVLVLVSNSGRKAELVRIATIAKERGIPVVVITHDAQSPLARTADIVLVTAKANEGAIRSAATSSLMLQLFVVDVLFTTLVSQNTETMLPLIKRSRSVIDENFS